MKLFVGVVNVRFFLRHARSLKDKRQVIKSISQRLINRGFSVVESADHDIPKRASLGFSLVGTAYAQVEKNIAQALQLFGPECAPECEIIQKDQKIFDYCNDGESFEAPSSEKYDSDGS